VTADNTSNNDTTAQELERQLRKCGVDDWNAAERKLGRLTSLIFGGGCMAHIVQLGIEDFMSEATKVGIIENKQAIWDYDPT
ncbi:hypothetical protein C8Q72DRAFT_743463, partial [Fomitopsis betulina]